MPADRLATRRRGAGDRLVLVHGFTQTARSWGRVADQLATHHEVVTVDAPGHGGSTAVAADLTTGASLLGTAGGRATYVGYSMGGRLCLQLALDRPHLVQRLVLISATAGIEDPDARAARQAADDELASSIERDGVDDFLSRWVARPMFATLAEPDLDDRRRNRATGLAASLRLAGTGTQEPSWARLADVTMPVLLVAGALDRTFVALAERMAGSFPNATLVVVDGAGHTVHLERPERFLDALTQWLDVTG